MLYMPYVGNYETILKENNIDYDIINWDRFGIEEISEFTYRDNKIGHQRSFFDYYRYYKFIVNILANNNFDKILVFGLQIAYFLNRYLIKNYKNKYIIDIRDYNRILKIFNPKKVIESSKFTVISSPRYNQWLPKCDKYVIDHNTQIQGLEELESVEILSNEEKINIAYIGAIRDYKVNIDFIDSLKNNKKVDIYFHGEGDINKNIQDYLNSNNICNVYITGRYKKEDEENLYYNNNLINVLRYDDGINNQTALPNRLYNAAVYGKPMLAYSGTYLAEIIKNYKLGLVLNSFKDIEGQIRKYLSEFEKEKYNHGRKVFFQNIIEEKDYFHRKLEMFALDR